MYPINNINKNNTKIVFKLPPLPAKNKTIIVNRAEIDLSLPSWPVADVMNIKANTEPQFKITSLSEKDKHDILPTNEANGSEHVLCVKLPSKNTEQRVLTTYEIIRETLIIVLRIVVGAFCLWFITFPEGQFVVLVLFALSTVVAIIEFIL